MKLLNFKFIFSILLTLICALVNLQGAGTRLIAKLASETVNAAAVTSKRTLGNKQFQSLSLMTSELSKKYGDEIFPLIRRGGIELLEQSVHYGDEFWNLARQVPAGARSLALHAPVLMGLAKRIGPEVLELEARTPGLSARVVQEFGDEGVRLLIHRPAGDTVRLLGYAKKADSSQTKKLLWDCYKKSPASANFLDKLNWKHIMATGLSSAAIISAYKVANGLEAGINNPQSGKEIVSSYLSQINLGEIGRAHV